VTTQTQELIEQWQLLHQSVSLEKKELPFRNHLGLSNIGEPCHRAIWFGFRWTTRMQHPAWLVRLFERGHLEEPRFNTFLRSVGIKVQDVHPETGKQFKASRAFGHVGGSTDGFAYGFVEHPNEWVLLEMKTHSLKSFESLVKKGVKIDKPKHFAQVQVYMRSFKLSKCFYMAVCKNNDNLYSEWIYIDEAFADEKLTLADSIAMSQAAPDRVALSSTDYRCRMCDHRGACWNRVDPDVNCRTCHHSFPNEQGTWSCAYNGSSDIDAYNPCGAYTKHEAFIKPEDIIISLKM
jgi:hypothetical protein